PRARSPPPTTPRPRGPRPGSARCAASRGTAHGPPRRRTPRGPNTRERCPARPDHVTPRTFKRDHQRVIATLAFNEGALMTQTETRRRNRWQALPSWVRLPVRYGL